MRFQSHHRLVHQFARRYRLHISPFTVNDSSALAYFEGKANRWSDIENGGVELFQGAGPTPTATDWDTAFKTACGIDPDGVINWKEVERRTQRRAFDDVMTSVGWTLKRTHAFLLRHGWEQKMSTPFSKVAFDMSTKYRSSLWRLTHGMDGLVNGLRREVPDIRYQSPVTRIEQDASSARVHFSNPDGEHHIDCDVVVLTTTLPSLERITFDPPLSERKRAATNIPYDSAVKSAFQFSRPFWTERHAVRSGISMTDLPIRAVHYPEPGAPPVLIVGYAIGEHAKILGQMPEETRLGLMLENLEVLHPGISDYVEVGATVAWQNDPFALGAFPMHHWASMPSDELMQDLTAPEGRIFFAGDHTNEHNGWLEGALISSERVAHEIARSRILTDTPTVQFERPGVTPSYGRRENRPGHPPI